MIRYALFTSVILAGLSAASCWERNENIYCDGKEWFCNDPAYPFCNGNRCEARPTDMSTVDVGPDSAPICTTSSACDPATPICDNNACRPCTGPADDAECSARSNGKPWCFNGACVSCRENAHCANTTPICGSGNVCRACTAHSECASLVCNLDGSCAPPSMVAYVDNANGTCTGAHSGTSSTDATCTIEQGIAVGRPIVRVAGSTVAYPKVAISSGTVTIVGPGQKGVSPSAKVSGDLTNPAFNISGATTTVTIDGIEVSGGGAGQDGIVCSNGTLGPTLTLRRMFIANVPGAGVSTTRCRITIERSQIGPGNTGGGIVLSSSQYSIVNNFVVANGSSNAAVSFGPSSTVLTGRPGFMHNVVAGNGLVGTIGGLSCNAGVSVAIENSIVYNNTKTGVGAAATQNSGNCSFTFVSTDEGTLPAGTGNTSSLPDVISTLPTMPDYHLAGRTAANNACCIDKIATSPVSVDYDGRNRPQPASGMFDIGAHEVP